MAGFEPKVVVFLFYLWLEFHVGVSYSIVDFESAWGYENVRSFRYESWFDYFQMVIVFTTEFE